MSRTSYLTFCQPSVTKLPPLKLFFHKQKQLVPYTSEPIMRRLETIGRVCYQSADKITKDSYRSFVTKLVERRHWSVLEHVRLLLCLPTDDLKVLLNYQQRHQLSAIVCRHYDWLNSDCVPAAATVSCSYRHLLELLELTLTGHCLTNGFQAERDYYLAYRLYELLTDTLQLPVPQALQRTALLNPAPECPEDIDSPPLLQWFTPIYCDPVCRWKLLRPDPDYVTFKLVCDRGISHELVRHRFEFSFTQESTRYVDYSKSNVKVIGDPGQLSALQVQALKQAAEAYCQLRERGVTPQEARGVLPTATATTIYVTASKRSWQSFLRQRCSIAAHPQMRELAFQIDQQLGKLRG